MYWSQATSSNWRISAHAKVFIRFISGIYSKHPYTEYISTRWYRAPECLMTDGYYDSKMDVWGYGCVLFEMISQFPLFNGSS